MIKQSENNVNIKPATVITITGTSENKILLKMIDYYYYNFVWREGDNKDHPVDILGYYYFNDNKCDFLSEIYDEIIVNALYTYKIRDITYWSKNVNFWFSDGDKKSLFGNIFEANQIF